MALVYVQDSHLQTSLLQERWAVSYGCYGCGACTAWGRLHRPVHQQGVPGWILGLVLRADAQGAAGGHVQRHSWVCSNENRCYFSATACKAVQCSPVQPGWWPCQLLHMWWCPARGQQ